MTKTVLLSAFETDGTIPAGMTPYYDAFGTQYGPTAVSEKRNHHAWQNWQDAGTDVLWAHPTAADNAAVSGITLQVQMPEDGYVTYWAARAMPSGGPGYIVAVGGDGQYDGNTDSLQDSEPHGWQQFWAPLRAGAATVQWIFQVDASNTDAANTQWLSRIEVYAGDDPPPGHPPTFRQTADPTLDTSAASVQMDAPDDGSGGGGTPAPAAYKRSEMVRHNGGLYIARVDAPTTEPGPGDSADWFEMVAPPAPAPRLSYVHEQGTPSDHWVIEHGLPYYPAITIVDSTGEVVEGVVSYPSQGVAYADFGAAFSGRAFAS